MAQEAERKKFEQMLQREDKNKSVFRVAKQMVKENKDVVGIGYVKSRDKNIVTDDAKILEEVWREHNDKLLNEEFDWNRNCITSDSSKLI